jgi:hypothetical protein
MNTSEQIPKDSEIVNAKDVFNNPELKEAVEPDSELKKWLLEYVGEKTNPENDEITVENIVEIMASEFPEFLMAVAEENWIRGYHQALHDVDEGAKLREQELQEKLNPETEEQEDEDA